MPGFEQPPPRWNPPTPGEWVRFPDYPEKVGRLPRDILGDLGALKSAGANIRLSVAGTLPNDIPGNFNDIVPERDIPYGSVGFTLVCRSASDFTKILAILYDYVTMGYTHELSGAGAGTVTLDPEDPTLIDQLVGAETVDDLLEEDNLWEVYFDGKRRFMWIGQTVHEPLVNNNEEKAFTISGPGIAETLEWGLVLPNRFPTVRPKLETVVDDFVDQDLDIYGTWKSSAGNVQAVEGRVNVTVTDFSSLGSHLSTAIAYDFTDSGVQARVSPYIGPNGTNGRVQTHLSVEETDLRFARIYTDLDTDLVGYVLVAETRGDTGIQITRIAFDPAVHSYWRLQELDGNVIFSYRPENPADAEWVTFATHPHSFNVSSVRLRLRVNAVSASNITLPRTSAYSLVNVGGVASPVPPMEQFRRLILKCQARGALTHVIPNWTPVADSMGAEWVSDATVDVQIGADLLAVLNDYCEAIQADWFMDEDFRLHIRQRIWSDSGADPTLPYHKEDSVIFYEAESQESKDRRRAFGNVRNYVVGKTELDEFVVKTDPGSIGKFQQRESLISNSVSTKDTASLETVLNNHLATSKDGTVSWTLTVPYDIEGKRLYEDYSLGDWISVQTSNPYRRDTWRIAAIAVQVNNDGAITTELTLNDKMTPYWLKVREEIKRQRWLRPNPNFRVSKNPGWHVA